MDPTVKSVCSASQINLHPEKFMSKRPMPFRLPPLVTAVCLPIGFSSVATAATDRFWNIEGNGNWSSGPADKNWNDGVDGPDPNFAWPNQSEDIANFQINAASTITVFGTVTTGGIRLSGGDYHIEAGTIRLTESSAGLPFIDIASGTVAIGSELTGTTGLLKSGPGTLILSGPNSYTGDTAITGGALSLSGASLIPDEGNLILSVGTSLRLGSDDESAGIVISNGGSIMGDGTLTAARYELNDGTAISGTLGTGILLSTGNVIINESGVTLTNEIFIDSGTLANFGTLGKKTMSLNIAAGATLIAGGVQDFLELTTSGVGAGTWVGNLSNSTTIAPGGDSSFGTLNIAGDFTNQPTGVLSLELGGAGYDSLQVTGAANFGGTLEISQSGPDPAALWTPYQVVAAANYSGNFSTISENLDGEIFFNSTAGEITRISDGSGKSLLHGLTRNQRSAFLALYDDTIDPGTSNIVSLPGGDPSVTLSGGLADETNPAFVQTLAASITPAGLDHNLLNRLSPAVYAGFSDLPIQTIRAHQRAAGSAPGFRPDVADEDAKSAKDAKTSLPLPPQITWEIFAALDYFDITSSSSRDDADYNISNTGLIVGSRLQLGDRVKFAGYVSADDGKIDGDLIDADSEGYSVGMLAEKLLEKAHSTRLLAGISYGRWSYDGEREAAVGNGSSWNPADVEFSDVDSSALDLSLGVETIAWSKNGIRLIPHAGLRFTSVSTDGFRETGNALPLDVRSFDRNSFLAELSFLVEKDITSTIGISGEIGGNFALTDESDTISARFINGSRTMNVKSDGISDDLLFLSAGGHWQATPLINIGLNYRAEARSGADVLNQINLGASVRF